MDVIGRDAELRTADAFLDAAAGGLSVLAIRGEAGIGKTTLFLEAVRRAGERGFTLLVARSAAAETQLTLTTLADIVEPVVDDAGGALPPVQKAALDAALLRSGPAERPLEPRLLGAATRSLFDRLASAGPVLVAIDDAQWTDAASATVLAFALRRLPSAPIGVLLALRTGEPSPPALGSIAGADRTLSIDVGPLSVAALHHVLKARSGRAPSRSALIRISEASGGSPLFALEISRALDDGGMPPAGEPLPVPADVRALVRDRIRRLPDATADVLLVAATAGRALVGLVARALGRPVDGDLAVAAREDVAHAERDTVVFDHPLFAAAVLAEATPDRRRAAHGRLAEVVTGQEERARHRALASAGPSADRAAELDAVAAQANGRGAPASAVELLDLAIALTPGSDRSGRDARRLLLGEYAHRAGDAGRAQEALERVITGARDPGIRARAGLALAAIRYEADAARSALDLATVALHDAEGDTELMARAHATLAAVDWEDFSRPAAHVAEASRLLDAVDDPDPVVLGLVLMQRCAADVAAGRRLDPAVVERGLALEDRAAPASVADRFSASLGAWLKALDDFAGARLWLERTHRAAVEEGDEGSLPYALSHLPELELWTGDWPAAEAFARRHLEISTDRELESQRRQALYNLALVHVHQGRADARAEIDEALAAAATDGDTWTVTSVTPLLGLLELLAGNAAAAAGHLLRATELREEMGHLAPRRHDQDLVESLLATGHLDQAREALEAMEARADRFGRHSALANAARSRALVAASSGDLDGAIAALDRALAEHDAAPIEVDRARTQLALGQVRRRRRERTAAKTAFDEALAAFERLGAAPWAERTRVELARTGLRRAAGPGLTETERRVAELAASGMTNREVAATLFLSPKTVEANLSRAYAKLGVGSRAELGALLGRVRGADPLQP